MVRHGGSSAGSYLTDPTSPISSHCASIVATSTVREACMYMTKNIPASSAVSWVVYQFSRASYQSTVREACMYMTKNIPASSAVSWVVYQFSRASYQSGLMLLILLMLAMLLSMHLSNTIVIPNSSWQQACEQLTFHNDKTCNVYLQWAGLFTSASGHHIKVVSCHGCCCSKP